MKCPHKKCCTEFKCVTPKCQQTISLCTEYVRLQDIFSSHADFILLSIQPIVINVLTLHYNRTVSTN